MLSRTADVLPGILSQEKGNSLAYPCVVPAQILPGKIAGEFGVVRRAKPILAEQALRPGDVVVRRVNPDCAAVFAKPPPSKEATPSGAVLPSSNVLVVRPGPDLLPEFAAFLLSATSVLARIKQASGVGKQVAALSPARLAAAEIPLPPLAVQRRYAEAWRASLRAEAALRARADAHARFRRLLGDAAFRPHDLRADVPGDAAFRPRPDDNAAESRIP